MSPVEQQQQHEQIRQLKQTLAESELAIKNLRKAIRQVESRLKTIDPGQEKRANLTSDQLAA